MEHISGLVEAGRGLDLGFVFDLKSNVSVSRKLATSLSHLRLKTRSDSLILVLDLKLLLTSLKCCNRTF